MSGRYGSGWTTSTPNLKKGSCRLDILPHDMIFRRDSFTPLDGVVTLVARFSRLASCLEPIVDGHCFIPIGTS